MCRTPGEPRCLCTHEQIAANVVHYCLTDIDCTNNSYTCCGLPPASPALCLFGVPPQVQKDTPEDEEARQLSQNHQVADMASGGRPGYPMENAQDPIDYWNSWKGNLNSGTRARHGKPYGSAKTLRDHLRKGPHHMRSTPIDMSES